MPPGLPGFRVRGLLISGVWPSGWLEEAALFAAIDSSIPAEFWWQWPVELRDRLPEALDKARAEHKGYVSDHTTDAEPHKTPTPT